MRMETNLKHCVKDEEESLSSSTILIYLDIIKFQWARTEINNRGGRGLSARIKFIVCAVFLRDTKSWEL